MRSFLRACACLMFCALVPFIRAHAAVAAAQVADPDTTPPLITPQVSGPAGTNGWHTGAVTIAWTVAEPESGVATSSGCETTAISSDTAGQTLTCSATNTAGLGAQASVTVKIDTTGPAVTGEPTSKPDVRGWHTRPLTVAFSGSDPVSGIVGCTGPVGYAGPDTKDASVSGSCANGAGLSASAAVTFKYDSSAPEITASVTGIAGTNGWYVGNVGLAWSVSDAVSGISSSSGCEAATLSADTAGTTVTCAATNGAGLTTQRSVTIKIDRAAPDTTISGGPNGTVTASEGSFTFAASESGATFACSLDGGGFEGCTSPHSYSGLADGAHVFRVRATDAAGNTDATAAERSWTVRAAPPNLKLPAGQAVEATSPSGAVVTYNASADDRGEPIAPESISCTPRSGATFPLGATTVTCGVTNAYGVSTSGSFVVTVVDTTPPRLTAPNPLVLSAGGPVPRSNGSISAFLGAARAVDLADAHASVTSNAPETFPIGTTPVTFTARDASGNVSTATSSVRISQASPGSPPTSSGSSSAADRTPPGDVRSVDATPGDRSVTLSWDDPPDADFQRVDVFRAELAAETSETRIYSGRAHKLVDRGLKNGTQYHYVLVAVDKAGNRSGGVFVTATPKAALLLAPKDGARLKRPPVLVWAIWPAASYYNVQLWRGGTKILSAWPTKARWVLRQRWQYAGRVRSLSPGEYRWYVWPGLGARAEVSYGPVLGMQTFSISMP